MTPFGILWRGAALLLGLSALIPTRTGTLVSHPHPATSYAEAAARVADRQAVDDRVAAPIGRTILLTVGHRTPRVFLLLHGLTDSPRQFLPLGKILFAQGDNVYIPRLPRHAELGGDAGTLNQLTAEQLRDCADSSVDIAAGLGDSVIVVGLSLGGTMAAWIGQNRHDVHRVVMIAPALEAAELPSVVEKPLENLTLRVPGMTRRNAPDTASPDREPGFNTRAIAQMFRLAIALRKAAANSAPASGEAEFLVNAHDRTVKTATSLDLAHRWKTHGMPVQVYELPDSLRLPHDVVDDAVRTGHPEIIAPIVEALAYGKSPPAWLLRMEPRAVTDTVARSGSAPIPPHR